MRASFWALLFMSWLPLTGAAQEISYSRDIQPIFTQKCVACHACYDSPCQLNLGSPEGLTRGASKTPIYDGARRQAIQPTRLFQDAQTEEQWRELGFFSVLDDAGTQANLITNMLALGKSPAWEPNSKLPAHLDISTFRNNTCPLPSEMPSFAQQHANIGMPFAVTGLSDDEYALIEAWTAAGSPVDKAAAWQSTPEEDQLIARWEGLLNGESLREQLVGRWLYEHLFLSHSYFPDAKTGHFYQWVRSRTPSGEDISEIVTRRPNDAVGVDRVYYRLRPVNDVIVHKTHITYPLTAQGADRAQAMFLESDWDVEKLPGHGAYSRSNPFSTFEAIPAQARYQFMLDNAEYFVRTFIRGPVCRGQIATDVIRDQFWVMFQTPESDLFIQDADYRANATPLLAVPGEIGQLKDLINLVRVFTHRRNEYEQLRLERYQQEPGTAWEHIWQGNDNALLTVFRNHDSATVEKGLIGQVPLTQWWIDFPLFERIYYQLVVNFDVFGSVTHQAQTRLYFDLLRNGSEQNFLRLLPASERAAHLQNWYAGSGRIKLWLTYSGADNDTPSLLKLPEGKGYQAFSAQLPKRFAQVASTRDQLNRCVDHRCYRMDQPLVVQRSDALLHPLTTKKAKEAPFILQLPEVTFLRVEYANGQREMYSLLRNRAHKNVAYMLGEDWRYQPKRDRLTIAPGLVGSYPNFMFNVKSDELIEFVDQLGAMKKASDLDPIAARWGIRRTHPDFWFYFNDLKTYMDETNPVEAGVFDMNRYENL